MNNGEDLITAIKNRTAAFSKSQRMIGDYILSHYDKAAYMTAAKLGVAVGISESTVVRFAVELGYDGYPEMQKSLQSYIKNKLTAIQRIEIASDQTDHANVLKSVLSQDIARIKYTLEQADEQHFKAAVESILTAKKVYVFGAMSSSALSGFLGNYLGLIFDNIVQIPPQSESGVYQQLVRAEKGDTLIAISFPRYSKTALSATSYARSIGANIIAITDSDTSPLAPLADQLLLAKSDMASFADSLVAPLSVINALIVALSIAKKEQCEQVFAKLERIWDENDVYQHN